MGEQRGPGRGSVLRRVARGVVRCGAVSRPPLHEVLSVGLGLQPGTGVPRPNHSSVFSSRLGATTPSSRTRGGHPRPTRRRRRHRRHRHDCGWYAWSWGMVWVPLVILAYFDAVALGGVGATVGPAAAGVVAASLAARTVEERSYRVQSTPAGSVTAPLITTPFWILATSGGLLAGSAHVAYASLGPIAWALAGVAALTSPAVIDAVTTRSPSHPPGPASRCDRKSASPSRTEGEASDLTARSDAELCQLWRESLGHLRSACTPGGALSVVVARRRYLAELERRHPAAMHQWVAMVNPDADPQPWFGDDPPQGAGPACADHR